MLNIAVTGAGGRMGRTIVEAIQNLDGCQVTAAFEYLGSSLIGSDVGELAGIGKIGVEVTGDIDAVLDSFDVMIDFTSIDATLDHLEICKNNGIIR